MSRKKLIKVRFDRGETGWAENLGHSTVRVANIPLTKRYNIDDVVELKPPASEDDWPRLGQVLQRRYAKKSSVSYPAPHQKNYTSLRKAFTKRGCKIEGMIEGWALVAHDRGVDLEALAQSAGVRVKVKG